MRTSMSALWLVLSVACASATHRHSQGEQTTPCANDGAVRGPVSIRGECGDEVREDLHARRFVFRPGRGNCRHDRDCHAEFTCEGCDTYEDREQTLECVNPRSSLNRYCGCVEGSCAWFTPMENPTSIRLERAKAPRPG